MAKAAFEESLTFEPIFVARQPIFNRDMVVWGYELLFRHSGQAQRAEVNESDVATAQVIADGFTLALTGASEEKRYLINFPQGLLLEGTPYALPKELCVVEILEDVEALPEVLKECERLREAGYTLALDDYVGQEECKPFLEHVDIVKVEVMGMSPPELIRISNTLQKSGVKLLAEKIETKKEYLLAKSLGYDYFQGYYFQKPEIVPGRKISLGSVARFKLLGELSRTDYEVSVLSNIISTDTSLSYRLLKYINSVAFSFRATVHSISQAVAILGSRPLKQWLMAVVISDISPNTKTSELALLCVQRGRFLEILSETVGTPPYDGDTMFLFGLFSELDVLLGQTMEELLKEMPLDVEIKDVLIGKEGRAMPWLHLVRTIEHGHWDAADVLLGQLGLSFEETAIGHAQATAWASTVMGAAKRDADEVEGAKK